MLRKKTSVILQCALREYDGEQDSLIWELRDLDALAGELRLKSIAYERLLQQELDPSSAGWANTCNYLREVKHKLDALQEFRKTLVSVMMERKKEGGTTNMITVICSQRTYQISEEIWQYDRGQSLCIEGLPEAEGDIWIQFSLNKTGGQTRDFQATVTDAGLVVPIPDDMLENKGTHKDYAIYVFAYQKEETRASTLCCISLPVHSRPRPVPAQDPAAGAEDHDA